MEFQEGLQKHLRKCELEYRSKNLPAGSTVKWLSQHCQSVDSISDYLRSLGFRIKEIVDEKDCAGEQHQWVVTTSGVVIYVNREGLLGFVKGQK